MQRDSAFSDERCAMVATQIVARGIEDPRVLAAMRQVPRHRFVSESYRAQAYTDQPIPIGSGQTISQPYMVAAMTEMLGLDSASRVLEIGTGSGYQTAILAELSEDVYTIEAVGPLLTRARQVLEELFYTNIHFRCGDGSEGWAEAAPFDGVIVTCAPETIPEALIRQLAEGGRMVAPIGPAGGVQTLYLVTKQARQIVRRPVMSVRFVPLVPGSKGIGV